MEVEMTTSEQNEREAFEKLFCKIHAKGFDLSISDDISDEGEYIEVTTYFSYKAFKFAWQYQQSRINELEERLETHIAINKSLLLQRDKLQAQLNIAESYLDKLQRLGNEPHVGNSIGNSIATEALNTINKMKAGE
jgi:hypothetical protein